MRPRPAARRPGSPAGARGGRFLELDTREDLLEGRCLLIQILWPKLEERAFGDPQEKADAEAFLEVLSTQGRLLHTACGRAFVALYEQDRNAAWRWYKAASRYLSSKDPTILNALVSATRGAPKGRLPSKQAGGDPMALNPQSSQGAVRSDINVTPLVDVCLVLLIIFMVVTPLIQSGVKVDLPETAKASSIPEQSSQLTVSIQEDGSLWLNGCGWPAAISRDLRGDPSAATRPPRGRARRPPPPVREGLRGPDDPERRRLHPHRAGDGAEAVVGQALVIEWAGKSSF